MRLVAGFDDRFVLAVAACAALAFVLMAKTGKAQQPPSQSPPAASREAPARPLPVPDTVSPETQKIIAGQPGGNWNVIPKTPEEWATAAGRGGGAPGGIGPGNQALLDRFSVKSEPTTVNGVAAYMLTPANIPPE